MKTFSGLSLVVPMVFALAGCSSSDSSNGTTDEAASKLSATFETFSGVDDQFYFNITARNGEIVLRSEGYTSTSARDNGVESVKTNGATTSNYEVLESKDGQFYFNLKAGNNKIIGTSETYVSKSNADRAVTRTAQLVKNIKISEAPREPRWEIFKSDNDSQFYFHLRAGNGEIVLASEGYTTKENADKGIDAVTTAIVNGFDPALDVSENWEEREAKNGQFYAVIKANNNEIVGVTELYVSKSGLEKALGKIEDGVFKTIRDAAKDKDALARLDRTAS